MQQIYKRTSMPKYDFNKMDIETRFAMYRKLLALIRDK